MDFIVIYDACVLYPAPLRDLLIRIALTELVRACWTERILDECFENIRANRPDLAPEALSRTRTRMNEAVPDCLVSGYEPLIDGLTLPDPDDRHVVAAAVKCGAQAIITFNLRDFPDAVLRGFEIEALTPDAFVFDLIDLSPRKLVRVIEQQAAALKNPPMAVHELLVKLEQQGLAQSVARLRQLLR